MSGDFDAMVAEAEAVNVSGWDFGWLEGRATEQRPSWGYQRLVGDRLASVGAALDIQTRDVGPESASELYEFFLGPQPHGQHSRHPDRESTEAVAVGLRIETLRMERLRMEFFDIGAVVYFLRKVVWTVPDFSVQCYRDRLLDLHERIGLDGRFVAHSSRVLIEAEALA